MVDANTASVDAAELTSIPNVTGDFLMGLDPAPFPGSLFKFRANIVLIDGTTDEPKIKLTLFPLDARNNVEIGEAIHTNPDPIPVATTGEFTADIHAETPGKTNPVSGTALTFAVTIHGIIRSEDHFCGTLEGEVVAPFTLDLNGSTVGGLRVPDGGTVNDVEPIGSCLDSGDEADAGAADAGTVDAGTVDAGAVDAGAVDAGAVDAGVADAGA